MNKEKKKQERKQLIKLVESKLKGYNYDLELIRIYNHLYHTIKNKKDINNFLYFLFLIISPEILFSKQKKELSKIIKNNKDYKEILLNINSYNSKMGLTLKEEDSKLIFSFLKEYYNTKLNKSVFEKAIYIKLKTLLSVYSPHVLDEAGVFISANLISHTKGLKKLAFFTAAKIQVLGAEKALFKHKVGGVPSPKYGFIFYHKEIQNSKHKGKSARKLACRISKAAKIDYFRNK